MYRGVLAACLLLPVASAANSELYRYTNAEGNVVIDHRVPPEYVSAGYEVLNERGVVMRVVPRELTEEELANRSAQERLEAEALEEQKRLREWDESLLLRYSSIEDIEAARERELRDLQIRVSILKSNKRSLRQQVETYQAQAADQERLGRSVDAAHLTAIADLQGEIESTDRSIADREEEIDAVRASFQKDIDRFEQLLEVVELRRSLASQ
ncbi:MAG: hypothetical protein HRT76_12010 [Halieaceae bacterium]|nr:hypothetical protein [Halieaceae bacterium]